MDETRDEATGQFVPTPEPAFGKEALELDAGFTPLKDDEPEADELTVAEAAEELTAQGTPESEIKTYGAISDFLAEDNASLTVEQAAKLLSNEHNAEAEDAEKARDDALRAAVDKQRGVEPEAKSTEAKPEAAPEAQPAREGELDPEIEKALSNPRVQAALSQHVAETETKRQEYVAGFDTATQIATASMLSDFPELLHIPAEQRAAALQAMHFQEPARYAKLMTAYNNCVQAIQQQDMAHRQEAQAKQGRFQEYAKAEDAKFSALITSESKETMDAIPKLIHEALIEYGADPAEFGRLGLQSEFLRSAAAQRLLVDAAKYRQITKASKAVSSRALPHVQRPGTTRSASERRGDDVGSLDRRLSQSGNIKDAVALMAAKRKAG